MRPIALLSVFVSTLAFAATPEREARSLFEEGKTALSTGRFAEARDLFRRSLELVPKAGSAFNLAVALRGTGEALEAVATLDRLLAGELGEIAKAQRSEAEALRAQASADIGSLAITVSGPSTARVRIDGRDAVADPSGHYGVDAGAHTIEASAVGFESAEARIEVARGAKVPVPLTLVAIAKPSRGTLIVEADPEDRVRVVGQAEGIGNLERALDPGRYRLEAEGPSGLRSIEAEVIAGQTVRVRLEAESSSVLSSPWLWAGVGAAVIAGVVITVIAVGGPPEPVSDPTYGVIRTLRAR